MIYSVRSLPDNFEPGPSDVVVAKGKKWYNHAGNRMLRGVAASKIQEYENARSKMDKSCIISSVVDTIREHGHFVKLDKNGRWLQAEDLLCREKTSAVFREALQSSRRSSFSSLSNSGGVSSTSSKRQRDDNKVPISQQCSQQQLQQQMQFTPLVQQPEQLQMPPLNEPSFSSMPPLNESSFNNMPPLNLPSLGGMQQLDNMQGLNSSSLEGLNGMTSLDDMAPLKLNSMPSLDDTAPLKIGAVSKPDTAFFEGSNLQLSAPTLFQGLELLQTTSTSNNKNNENDDEETLSGLSNAMAAIGKEQLGFDLFAWPEL